MSTGGIFRLIANDGAQDKLLLASEYLSKRLTHIKKLHDQKNLLGDKTNKKNDINFDNSWTPSVDMINKTHFIFTNGSFKPFVAVGLEYNKINAIAQFGNYTTFTLLRFGDFINDCVIHIKLTGLKAINSVDRVRYVSFLGHKLLSTVSFTVNGNPLDEYTTDDYNAFYQFHVPANKQVGWLRDVGQEVPTMAYLTADPLNDTHREYRMFGDGNQTFKRSHDEVELWIPLLFWFRKVNNSLPNGAIPFGQTDIKVAFANVSDIVGFSDNGGGGRYTNPTISLCELYMNNIFMNPDVSNIFMKKFGFSLIRVHGRHIKEVLTNADDILLNNLRWPTECLYVAFKPQSNLQLSQNWQSCSTLTPIDVKIPVAARNPNLISNVIVNNTAAPTTNSVSFTLVSGLTITATNNYYVNYDFVITGGTGYSNADNAKNKYIVKKFNAATNNITIFNTWNIVTPDTTTTFELYTAQILINVARYYKETPTVSEMGITANTIVIFNEISESFYNSYIPFRYGENMNTPTDRGWYMINFNLLPGDHQPSGHINISRARQFRITYKNIKSTISRTNPVNLIVLSDAINFLLVSDGSAVLRYST